MSSMFDTTTSGRFSQIDNGIATGTSGVSTGMSGLLSGSRLDTVLGQYSQSNEMGPISGYGQSSAMAVAMPYSATGYSMGGSQSVSVPRPSGLPDGARFFICETVYQRGLHMTILSKIAPLKSRIL